MKIATGGAAVYLANICKHPDYPNMIGRIYLVRDTRATEIVLELTERLELTGQVVTIPAHVVTSGWVDVTGMVQQANYAIRPDMEPYMYINEAASNYRNFLDYLPPPKRLSLAESLGNVVLMGDQTASGKVLFNPDGYHIIAYEQSGLCLAYKGYCTFADDPQVSEPSVSLLRISDTGSKGLYMANQIVLECNAQYRRDFEDSESMVENIRLAIRSDIESPVASSESGSLRRLHLA